LRCKNNHLFIKFTVEEIIKTMVAGLHMFVLVIRKINQGTWSQQKSFLMSLCGLKSPERESTYHKSP